MATISVRQYEKARLRSESGLWYGLGQGSESPAPQGWSALLEALPSACAALSVLVSQPSWPSLDEFVTSLLDLSKLLSSSSSSSSLDGEGPSSAVHSDEFWACLSVTVVHSALPTLPQILPSLLQLIPDEDLELNSDRGMNNTNPLRNSPLALFHLFLTLLPSSSSSSSSSAAHVLASLQTLVKQLQGQDVGSEFVRAVKAASRLESSQSRQVPKPKRTLEDFANFTHQRRDYLAEAREFVAKVRTDAEREAEEEAAREAELGPPTAQSVLLANSIYKRSKREEEYHQRKLERQREREAVEHQASVRFELERQAHRNQMAMQSHKVPGFGVSL